MKCELVVTSQLFRGVPHQNTCHNYFMQLHIMTLIAMCVIASCVVWSGVIHVVITWLSS